MHQKKSENWRMQPEYRKDKVILITEKITNGEYSYEIELEVRYSGNYLLNPARAELCTFRYFMIETTLRILR